MRILLDQDQVLAKWVEKVLAWYNEDYKTEFTVEDVKSYFAMESLLGPMGRHFIRSCIRYPDFYSDLDPVEGSIGSVKQLVDQGHDVVIVSAVPRAGAISFNGKLVWMRKFMPWFNLNNFIACSRKELIHGDILLDDATHNCHAFVKTGREAALFDRPWNRNAPSDQYSVRINSWAHFMIHVAGKEAAAHGTHAPSHG